MSEEALSAAQRSKIRRLSAPVQPEAGEEGGELNIVPYLDIIMNVMMFVLATVSVAFVTTIHTSAASANPGVVRDMPSGLRLTALITQEGVALKTAAASIAPGCDGVGLGITVPNRGDQVDVAALTACARKIKATQAAEKETQVTLTASPGIPYATVVTVMDGLRSDAEGELFPEVTLGAVR
jgi:biopolymer transport protein ExbD